jgi:anaerobic selenocysteine-containing dehydrogenase
MFSTPAVDPLMLASRLGVHGSFDRYRSRVSGKPEFSGQLPVSVLAEEIEVPGPGQVRALITSAGNPVLSVPGSDRLETALRSLDFMVSIDPYLNETTRLAHVILPPTSALERSHYDAAMNAYAVRNVAKFSAPVFERDADARHDWEICLALWTGLGPLRRVGPAARLIERVLRKLGPEALLDLALRLGPHRLSLAQLKAAPHGLDLGPLERRLPERLQTASKRIDLAPAIYLADLERLGRQEQRDGLVLIGRRDLRSNNSWMHNSARLMKGPDRCTLMIHPVDASARGLVDGASATVTTPKGSIVLPVEVSDSIMIGVVSIPHGWGHRKAGARLRVASAHPGQNVNKILDDRLTDVLSGTSMLSGQRVEVTRA